MSAWSYCVNEDCNAGLNQPTPLEDLQEGQVCPYCGVEQPNQLSVPEWLDYLWAEMQEMKRDINK